MYGDVKAIFSLYRSCLREINRLPADYLRQFFRLKVGDDVRTLLNPGTKCNRINKMKRVFKDLRKLERANEGHVKEFQYVLHTAYGRRGPLKWELFQSLRATPGHEPPEPIIPFLQSSRPPVWSPELVALVTSPYCRTKKILRPSAIKLPPKIPPERMNPDSREYKILGPFSKRREVNERRRFFAQQFQRTYFPLQVVVEDRNESDNSVQLIADPVLIASAGARSIGLQGAGVFEELEALASPAVAQSGGGIAESSSTAIRTAEGGMVQSPLSQRFLRRQYQRLLASIPVLVFNPTHRHDDLSASPPRLATPQSQLGNLGITPGRYKITLSPSAAARYGPIQAIADDVDQAWITLAEQTGRARK